MPMHRFKLCLYIGILHKSIHCEDQPQPIHPQPVHPPAYVVLQEVRVVPLYAVIEDGDHHIFAGVAPLPGCQDIHL